MMQRDAIPFSVRQNCTRVLLLWGRFFVAARDAFAYPSPGQLRAPLKPPRYHSAELYVGFQWKWGLNWSPTTQRDAIFCTPNCTRVLFVLGKIFCQVVDKYFPLILAPLKLPRCHSAKIYVVFLG